MLKTETTSIPSFIKEMCKIGKKIGHTIFVQKFPNDVEQMNETLDMFLKLWWNNTTNTLELDEQVCSRIYSTHFLMRLIIKVYNWMNPEWDLIMYDNFIETIDHIIISLSIIISNDYFFFNRINHRWSIVA